MGQLQIYLPWLLVGVAALACGAGLYMWRQGHMALGAWREAAQTATRLQAQLESVEALLACDGGAQFLWDGSGVLRVWGGGEANSGNPDGGAFSVFCNSLTPASQSEFVQAVQTLRDNGVSFAFPLFRLNGSTLASTGKPAGAGVAVSITDVSEAFKEICSLRDALSETVEERDFLRYAIDSIPYPSWRRGSDGRLKWVNQAYCKAVDAASPADAVSRGEELIDRRAAGNAGEPGHSSRLRTVLAGQRRILDLFEAVTEKGSVGLAVDVTEIDDAQNEVRKQLAAQRASLNLLHTPVAIFSADRNLEFFNQGFADLWSLPADWLASGPNHGEVLEAMRASRRLPEQADFPAWKKQQLGCYTNLIDSQEEIWQLPNERTLRVVTQARPQGGLFVLYEDLTQLLTLERSLNALSQVQRETLNRLQEGVAVFGADGRISLFNPALLRIWNIAQIELAERPHIDELTHLYQELVTGLEGWDEIKSIITGGGENRDMRLLRLRRNDVSVIDCMIAPLPDGGTMLTFTDVTDSARIESALRERNDALETTDRLKSEFITHISYQFRTPLNSIIGFAEILEHQFFGELNERQHEYSQGLLEASHHLLTLVNDVIDLATIEAGHMSLSCADMDVQELLLSVRELSRHRAREADITLLLECSGDIGVIQADSRRIKQVMFNLMSNAIRFSAAGDEIVIGANRHIAPDGREICRLWVRDRGAGIDRNYQASMFNAFESRAPKGKEQGAGIGLSLVRSLIELHDGWVEVESEPGKGTKVICNLPLMQAATVQDMPLSPPLAIQAGRGRP